MKELSRKAMPCRGAAIHDVKTPLCLPLEESQDSRGNVGHETGRTPLVIYNAEFIPLHRQSQHRVGKIPAANRPMVSSRIEAAGSDNHMPGRRSCGLLPSELAGPVLVDRARRIRLCVRHRAGRIGTKHIVGADLNQRSIHGVTGGRQLANRVSIHQPTGVWIAFRRIDSRPGGAVDDDLRTQLLHDIPNHGGLREVELRSSQRHGGRPQQPAYLPAELARRACHGDRVLIPRHWFDSDAASLR